MLSWLRRRPPSPKSIDTAPWLFMRGLEARDAQRLRETSEGFLARKQFSGTHGLEVSERMRVEIAAQAAILVLELGLEWYQGWSEVIVYPSQFAPEREIVDEAGVVHLTNDPMAGEAWLGGPVVLSYEDVALAGDEALRVAGYNVVIHEFAHKLDMRGGDPNGSPPLHAGMSAGEFFAVASEAFFETPELLEPAYSAVYEQLRLFFKQDPLARLTR